MNGKLDVEVYNGRVAAVWFGCQYLPFEQIDVDEKRAGECDGRPNDAVIVERIALQYPDDVEDGRPEVW